MVIKAVFNDGPVVKDRRKADVAQPVASDYRLNFL